MYAITSSTFIIWAQNKEKFFYKALTFYWQEMPQTRCKRDLLDNGEVVGHVLHGRSLPARLETHQQQVRPQFAKTGSLQQIWTKNKVNKR